MKKIDVRFYASVVVLIAVIIYGVHEFQRPRQKVENQVVVQQILPGGEVVNKTISLSMLEEKSLDSINILQTADNEKLLRPVLEKFGLKAVMQKLVKDSNGGAAFDCHQQSHKIGRLGYELFKEKAFPLCDPSCHSGCYHGAMEAFLTEKGTANLSTNIDSVCKLFDTSFSLFECLHGVGHGVLAYMDYDLPSTLKQCGALKDSFSQTSCYGGAFMENIVTGQGQGVGKQDHETPWVNKTDPLYPCDKIDQSFDVQYQCYQMQTSWMLTLSGYNFDTVAKQCLGAPQNMISVCYKSFGRDAAGHTLRDPKKILDLCNKVQKGEGYFDQCIIGAVNVIIDFWGPGLRGQASDLCNLLDSDSKNTCYGTLAGRVPGLFSNKADQKLVCNTFEQQYKYLCQSSTQ